MLHRYRHAFNISSKALSEPSDLPNVIREDMLMLAPVDPCHLFATWHVSYSTQNRLRDFIGEDGFDRCRLLLTLKHLSTGTDTITVDVSGPSTSSYVSLEHLPSIHEAKAKNGEVIHLYGELNYQSDEALYPVTRSTLISLPRLYMADAIDAEAPPISPLYERLFRRLDSQNAMGRDNLTLIKIGEQLDLQLGVVIKS